MSQKIKEIMSEFDTNQRRFLGGLLHSTQFNKWQEQTLQEYGNYIRQQTLEEAIASVPDIGIEIENRNSTKIVLIDRQQTLSNLQALKDKN